MVGFRIDLTYGGTTGCNRSAFTFSEYYLGSPTSCLLPEPSLSASRPPGPMLLLRFFFATFFPCAASKLVIVPVSTLAFSSLPVIYVEVVCAIDLRPWRTRGGLILWLFDMLAALQALLTLNAGILMIVNLARRIRGDCKQRYLPSQAMGQSRPESRTFLAKLLASHTNSTSASKVNRNHGDGIDSTVGTRVPEATAHLRQSEGQANEEHQNWKGWAKMVQGRWVGLQDTQDCD